MLASWHVAKGMEESDPLGFYEGVLNDRYLGPTSTCLSRYIIDWLINASENIKKRISVERTTGETNALARLKEMEMQRDTIKEAMETSDVDMNSAEAVPEAAAGTSRKMENAWGLLSRARQLIAEGNPTLALQTVLSAIRSEGGENAVLRAMSRARELYRQRAQSEADMGDLTTLLAQCAIEEASGSSPSALSNPFCGPGRDPSELLTAPDAILAESGRRQVILDAFADGSSFICLNCGGLISSSRKDEHLENWCK